MRSAANGAPSARLATSGGLMLASTAYGAAFGLFPIGWVVFNAILLYNVTVESGQFAVVRDSVASLTEDRRLQALLIAFAFGAFIVFQRVEDRLLGHRSLISTRDCRGFGRRPGRCLWGGGFGWFGRRHIRHIFVAEQLQ